MKLSTVIKVLPKKPVPSLNVLCNANFRCPTVKTIKFVCEYIKDDIYELTNLKQLYSISDFEIRKGLCENLG